FWAAERTGRDMATADKRRDALGSPDGVRRAAARLGLSSQETRRILAVSESTPRDDVALVAALADALVDRCLDHGWSGPAVRGLPEHVAEASGSEVHRLALQVHANATRNPSLLALSPPLALEMQVRMLA